MGQGDGGGGGDQTKQGMYMKIPWRNLLLCILIKERAAAKEPFIHQNPLRYVHTHGRFEEAKLAALSVTQHGHSPLDG